VRRRGVWVGRAGSRSSTRGGAASGGSRFGAAYPISDPRLCDEEIGEGPVSVQFDDLSPDSTDVDVEVVTLLGVGGSPHRPEQAPARNDVPGIRNQHLEQLVLTRGQMELSAGDGHEAAVGAEAERADHRHAARVDLAYQHAAKAGPHAGME